MPSEAGPREAGPSEAGPSASEALFDKKKLVFFPCGRLGNAIFRYMGCAIVNIINPALEYTLSADFQQPSKLFTYYPGVDHMGDDIYQATNKDTMAKEALKNNDIVGYNSLGFFKHTIDLANIKPNIYINPNNGQGLYVKNALELNDANFLNMFYKKLENFHLYMTGYFQFGYLHLKFKRQILQYMETHKNEHCIQLDTKERFLMRDILDEMKLPLEKKYDIAIHIRLDDFKGRIDFIEIEYYLALFESMLEVFEGRSICIVYQNTGNQEDSNYIAACLAWFQERHIPIRVESNSLLVDFNIMKQVKILVCSMSTLAWSAAYLSKQLEQCYMPNYNFYNNTERHIFYFHKPIHNTILYNVKTTPPIIGQLKTFILTLPDYAYRLEKLDSLIQELAKIGLHTAIYKGVHGKDIHIHDAASAVTSIKHITWQDTTLFYDTRVRLNGVPMTRGEFGCAWSHLNILRQLVEEPSTNYYLILEDDVEMVKPISELYDLLHHVPADADLCHLCKSEWYPFIKTKPANAYFYECEKQFFNRTTAYLVSKKGAQKILEYAKNSINTPIDDLFNMVFRLTDFRFYVPADYLFKEQENASLRHEVIYQSTH
jgi:GR25 family glycosyltransferase involved in LPS biosynthesis